MSCTPDTLTSVTVAPELRVSTVTHEDVEPVLKADAFLSWSAAAPVHLHSFAQTKRPAALKAGALFRHG